MGVVVSLAIVAVCYAVAVGRKGRVGLTVTGSRRRDVFAPLDPAAVFARLQQIGGRYRVDDADPATRRLVLSSSVTLFSWGFFYPIEIHPHGTAGARIEVGIQSRLIQWGPVVTNAHQRCADELSQWLSVPAARVA